MNNQKVNKEERNRQYLATFQAQDSIPDSNPYDEESIEQNEQFLIVCEGENTERHYFGHFPVVNKSVRTVYGGYGGGKIYLVEQAEKIAKQDKYKGHIVWCVFDFDVKTDNPSQKQDYDNAIDMAKKKGYRVAFSNDCFELWFVLHYKFIQTPHHRTEYYSMLTNEWGLERSYESMGKQQAFTGQLYAKLLPNQAAALKNAKRLSAACTDGRPHHLMNPCTTVYELVEALNKYLRR